MRIVPALVVLALSFTACNNATETSEKKADSTTAAHHGAIKEEQVSYTSGDANMKSYVYFDEEKNALSPVVLVIPEWWGMTEYPRTRAKQLAGMGYIAMAVDLYGDGKVADDPQAAQASATPFYQDQQLMRSRFEAALARVKSMPNADTSKIAAIGYCFGGSVVLANALMGAHVNGVVSFHGGLEGLIAKSKPYAKVLVCHGGADSFVPEKDVQAFRKTMDAVGAEYDFKVYPNATHAFTNPNATEKGKQFNMPISYNGAADTASWNDMKLFLGQVLK